MWAFSLTPLEARAVSSDFSGTGLQAQYRIQLVSELLRAVGLFHPFRISALGRLLGQTHPNYGARHRLTVLIPRLVEGRFHSSARSLIGSLSNLGLRPSQRRFPLVSRLP